MVIIKSKTISMAVGEILRFVLITGIVVSPIIALLFSDSEYGVNSPIGLIMRSQGDRSDQAGNEWVISVGGVKSDNYTSGILIPVYVFIFGIVGGYLRYLYKTASLRFNVETSSAIYTYLFNWNKVPEDTLEVERLKQYFIHNFGLEWVSNCEVRRDDNAGTITIVSKDQNEKGQSRSISIKLNESKKLGSVWLGDP